MRTPAQRRAERKYDPKRQRRQVAVYITTAAQEQWLHDNRQPGEGDATVIKRLSGMPPDANPRKLAEPDENGESK